MQPLSPEELLKYATHFAAEEQTIARGKRVGLQIRISLDQLAHEQESQKTTVLEALGDAVIRNLEQYRVGADLPLVAWITRNIFELEIMHAFVTESVENLKSFANDVVLDEIQVRQAAIALGFDREDPEVARRQDEALGRLQKTKVDLGLTRSGPATWLAARDARPNIMLTINCTPRLSTPQRTSCSAENWSPQIGTRMDCM